jgi:hypothetical protein
VFNSLNKSKIIFFELLLSILYISATLFGIISFDIWQQITDILIIDTSENFITLLEMLSNSHPHTLRVMLIFPIYIISEYLCIDVVLLYSLVISILIFMIYKVNVLILANYIPRG